jgi:hypothetical protein
MLRMVTAKANQKAVRPAHLENTTDKPPCNIIQLPIFHSEAKLTISITGASASFKAMPKTIYRREHDVLLSLLKKHRKDSRPTQVECSKALKRPQPFTSDVARPVCVCIGGVSRCKASDMLFTDFGGAPLTSLHLA